MAATGAGSIACIDNVTTDSSSRSILFCQVQSNASKLIEQCFIPQQRNDAKQTPMRAFFSIMFQLSFFGKPIPWPMCVFSYFLAS